MRKDELYNLREGDTVEYNNLVYIVCGGLHSHVTLMSDHKIYPTLEVEGLLDPHRKRIILSVYNCEEFKIRK